MTRISIALLLTSTATIWAVDIPINNASFTSPSVSVGSTYNGIPPGWLVTSQPCTASLPGMLPPLGAGVAHPAAGTLVPSNDGSQTGFGVTGGTAIQYIQFCQTLSPPQGQTFAGYTYVLSVDFYHSPTDPPIGASIQMCLVNQNSNAQCGPSPGSNAPVATTGGTVSLSLLAPTNSSPSEVLVIGIAVGTVQHNLQGTTYFNHVRVQAIPFVPQSYGIVGMFAHQPGAKSVLSLLCEKTAPCEGTLEYHDLFGVLVNQKQVTLHPGTVGSLEQPGPLDRSQPPQELIPVWYLTSGNAIASFEMLDSTGRTSLFTNWADGSVSRMTNLLSGPVSLTSLDTARLKVYCDGSVRNPKCDATLTFTDAATGQSLSQSRVTLFPGTGTYLDIAFRDSITGAPRSVLPAVNISGGRGIADVTLFDASTGNTITQSIPLL